MSDLPLAFPAEISQPAIRAFASVGVTRLDQLDRFTECELLPLHGMGPKGIRILCEALDAAGTRFAGGKAAWRIGASTAPPK